MGLRRVEKSGLYLLHELNESTIFLDKTLQICDFDGLRWDESEHGRSE